MNSFSLFSVFFSKPFSLAVIIIGRAINTATQTGTIPDLNQNNAIRIKAITGVTRITASGKVRKALKTGKSAAKKPVINPIENEIKKAEITRKKENAKLFQNKRVLQSRKSLIRTVCGNGRISGAFIKKATAYHKSKRIKGAAARLRVSLEIFDKVKILIRKLSTN